MMEDGIQTNDLPDMTGRDIENIKRKHQITLMSCSISKQNLKAWTMLNGARKTSLLSCSKL